MLYIWESKKKYQPNLSFNILIKFQAFDFEYQDNKGYKVSIFKCQYQMQWSDLDVLKKNHNWSLKKFHVKKINLGPGLVNFYSPPLSVGFAVLADNRELISSHWRLMSLLTLPASGQIIPLFYIWTLLVFSYFFITTFYLRHAGGFTLMKWLIEFCQCSLELGIRFSLDMPQRLVVVNIIRIQVVWNI